MNNNILHNSFEVELLSDSSNGITEVTKDFASPQGQGSFKKLLFKNIHVCYGDIRLSSNHYISVEFDTPIVEMYFSILGEAAISTYSKDKTYSFTGNQHNLLFCPHRHYLVNTPNEKETAYSFHIIFPEEYYLNLINKSYPVIEGFNSERLKRNFAMLSSSNMTITPEMNSILQEIINCRRSGILKSLFVEAKIIKLLMLQLEQYEQQEYRSKKSGLKDHDIDKIKEAKIILEQNIAASTSIIELAHAVGINDFKLKKGFKEIYGTTVYGYLKDLRMLEAKKMLLENNRSISEIAMLCGYKFVQNFTKAFKQEFGITPDKFRV